MAQITLYEFEPTRSSKPRWALLEAGLAYESVGNSAATIGSADVRAIHPLGKLPAAIIDGKPLFESSAIVAAVADLAPEANLIAKPGTWARTLHDQWTCYAHSEIEAWGWAGLVCSRDFLTPPDQQVPAALPLLEKHYKRGVGPIETHLTDAEFMIDNRFSATDIIIGYTLHLGQFAGFLDDGFPNALAYLERLRARPHCALRPAG